MSPNLKRTSDPDQVLVDIADYVLNYDQEQPGVRDCTALPDRHAGLAGKRWNTRRARSYWGRSCLAP